MFLPKFYKAVVVALILLSSGWKTAEAACITTSPTPFTCPDDGFFCKGPCMTTYWSCVSNVAYDRVCPGNGVFDGAVCTTTANVPECTATTPTTTVMTTSMATSTVGAITTESSTVIASTTITPSGNRTCTPSGIPNTFNCPEPEGFYAIPNECSGDYYTCVKCSPYVTSCPTGSLFDPLTSKCTLAVNASCNQPFVCPAPDGFYPIKPDACSNKHYTCVSGNATLTSCPGTSIFDPTALKCKAKEDASCVPPASRNLQANSCPGDGFFPTTTQGECLPDYYVCVSGIEPGQQRRTCPAQSLYDPAVGKCMPTEYASCK